MEDRLFTYTQKLANSRDGHETSIAETETRPRRDVCRFRDMTETLRCTLSCTSKQVNVDLTTVATVIASPFVSWCILDFWVFNSSGYVQTMPLQPVGTGRWKNELYLTPCFWKLSCYINNETDVPQHQQRWWLISHLVRTMKNTVYSDSNLSLGL